MRLWPGDHPGAVVTAEPQLASGALVPVLTEWPARSIPLHIVCVPNRHLSNKLRVFIDRVARQATHDRLNRMGAAS